MVSSSKNVYVCSKLNSLQNITYLSNDPRIMIMYQVCYDVLCRYDFMDIHTYIMTCIVYDADGVSHVNNSWGFSAVTSVTTNMLSNGQQDIRAQLVMGNQVACRE